MSARPVGTWFVVGVVVLAVVAVIGWSRERAPASPIRDPARARAPAPATPTTRSARIPPRRPAVPAATARAEAAPAEAAPAAPDPEAAAPAHAVLAGTFLDDAGRPIADARCLVGLARFATAPGQPRPLATRTDATGTFRFPRAPIGESLVTCRHDDRRGSATVIVALGLAPVGLVAALDRERRRGTSGMTLEDVEDEVRIASIEPNGPAAKAGLERGDVIVEVDGAPARDGASRFVLRWIETRSRVAPVELVVMRGERELPVALTLVP